LNTYHVDEDACDDGDEGDSDDDGDEGVDSWKHIDSLMVTIIGEVVA
jgi:hypothetical protein